MTYWLCGNTIQQPLTYNELNQKCKDLGSDIELEDDLFKILYYNYYNPQEDNCMTFQEFLHFIQTKVYTNEKMKDQISETAKQNIDRLAQFTSESAMNQLHTPDEIANLLQIDTKQVEDVLIYYNAKHNNLKLSVAEFINFIQHDILTNPEYAGKITKSNQEKLKVLDQFTNNNINQTKITSQDMAKLFDLDNASMEQLYQYYGSFNTITTHLTIREFSDFVLNEMLNNPQYAGNFDKETIQNIKILNTFSNLDTITREMNATELANVFRMDESLMKQLLLLKYSTIDTGSTKSISEFVKEVVLLKQNTHYLDDVEISSLETLAVFAQNENDLNVRKMNQKNLASLFNPIRNGLVENIYLLAGLPAEYCMTPQEFINLVLTSLGNTTQNSIDGSMFSLDSNTLHQLNLLKVVIDDSVASNKTKYSASQISQILGLPESQMYSIYALIDFSQNRIQNWKIAPNELVNLVLANSNNPNITSNFSKNTLEKLKLLNNIMTSTIQNKNYNYNELATLIGIEENKVKSIFTLYQINHTTFTLAPNEFVNFVLLHQKDKALQNHLNVEKIKDLQTVQSVIEGVKIGKKYTSLQLANLLGIPKEDLELMYGLHISKQTKAQTISVQEFVEFLLNDVVTNPEYASNFDTEKTAKLTTLRGIMNATINDIHYTKDEIFTILAVLTDSLDKNTVDLLYVFYGSDQSYDTSWTMTVEEFVQFLNETILQDTRFDDFLEEEMRQNILKAKDTVQKAKNLLVGNGYSRIVLNTKFVPESEETFSFIQKVKNLFQENVEECYIIGDSPMAYEMSQTFNNELNFITILTMIAIFVVVAITFKSIILPVILVLTIQCAVYLTMGILSLSGGTVYFIALLIVQSILMGATIDYAILYASYYIEHRKTMPIQEAIIHSYNQSIHTILTSASILVIVTLIVGHFASAIAAKICITISQGTFCSTILILLLLPSVIAMWDKIIIKKQK